MRNIPVPKVKAVGKTLRLSNLCQECSRESGRTLRRVPHRPSHLWETGGLYAPRCPYYSRVRAQDLSSRDPGTTDDVAILYRSAAGWWCTQGCIGWYIPRVYTGCTYPGGIGRDIPGWCTGLHTQGGIYTRLYTRDAYPGKHIYQVIHPMYTLGTPTYPPWCTCTTLPTHHGVQVPLCAECLPFSWF